MPASAVLIALGLVPMPGDLLIVREGLGHGTPGAVFIGVVTAVQLAALMPLSVVLLDVVAGWRLPTLATKILGAAVVPIGFLATFVSLIDAGAGALIVLAKGAVLTFALSGALFWTARGRMGVPGRVMAWTMVAPATVAGVVSLATVPVVLMSARSLANGAPYCLALHKAGPAPIEAYPGLRLFSFHTTLAGYKDNQTWFFHGLLLVGSDGGERIYNWSPRRMAFEMVRRPDDMFERPRGACVPGGGRANGGTVDREGGPRG